MTDQPAHARPGAAPGVSRGRAFTRMMVGVTAMLIAAGVVLRLALVGERRDTAANEQSPGAPPPRLRRIGDAVAVVLDSAALRHARIETQALRSASTAATVRLAGELVADPRRVASIRAGLAGRLASVGGHWPSIGERVVAGTALGQVSDAQPFSAPRTGIVTRVGAQPGEIVQAGQELLQLTDLTAPVARMVWPLEAPAPPLTIRVSPLVGPLADKASARLIGPAADVDSVTRRPVYLYQLARAWPEARVGLAVTASVAQPGTAMDGLLVPATAVVQWQGLAWVFVERGPGRFVRVRVDTGHPASDGWIVSARPAAHRDPRQPESATEIGDNEAGALPQLAADDRVVVRGAAQLLSEEFRSRLPEGDADEGD